MYKCATSNTIIVHVIFSANGSGHILAHFSIVHFVYFIIKPTSAASLSRHSQISTHGNHRPPVLSPVSIIHSAKSTFLSCYYWNYISIHICCYYTANVLYRVSQSKRGHQILKNAESCRMHNDILFNCDISASNTIVDNIHY